MIPGWPQGTAGLNVTSRPSFMVSNHTPVPIGKKIKIKKTLRNANFQQASMSDDHSAKQRAGLASLTCSLSTDSSTPEPGLLAPHVHDLKARAKQPEQGWFFCSCKAQFSFFFCQQIKIMILTRYFCICAHSHRRKICDLFYKLIEILISQQIRHGI